MAIYKIIFTDVGLAKLSNAQVTQAKLNITQMAIGDANGTPYTPTGQETALKNEVYRTTAIVKTSEDDANWIEIEGVIPADVGNFTIEEFGLYDVDGDLVAISNYPSTPKPILTDGSVMDLIISSVIKSSNAELIEITLDPTTITASKDYVDNNLTEVDSRLTTQLAQTIVNIDEFFDGETDYSLVFNKAFASGYRNFYLDKIVTCETPIVIPASLTELHLDLRKSVITYTHEQNELSPNYNESLFYLDDKIANIKGGKIVYTGTFDFGASYDGKLSGIHAVGGNTIVENSEFAGFNNCGINISPRKLDAYNTNSVIRNCFLHHNRVAGLAFGNTDNLLIENNRCEFNGILSDIGTGYGLGGWRDAYPKNTKVYNNRTNDNSRKGIDFHSGFNGSIRDNEVLRNGIYGIFLGFENLDSSNNARPIGDWLVDNNIIGEMNGDKTNAYDIQAITITTYASNTSNSNFKITNNTISNFERQSKGAYVFLVASSGLVGNIFFERNVVDSQNISSFVRFSENGTYNSGVVDSNIIGNTFKATSCNDIPFSARSASRLRKLKINSNKINITDELTLTSLCNYADISESTFSNQVGFDFSNNNVDVVKANWGVYDLVLIYGRNDITSFNNFWNGKKYRDWDGKRYVMTDTTYALTDNSNWTRGSIINNSYPVIRNDAASGKDYIVDSWKRMTGGQSHALNTDWVECRTYTN